MDSLIFLSPFVNKFLSFFQFIFVNQTKPTRHSLLLLLLGIVMTSSLSVRKCYMRIISRISGKSLNSFYNLLTNGKIDLNVWSAQLIRLSLRCIPAEYEDAPILLAVDDTLVEKEGSHFAHRERLFDHSGYRDKKNDKENSQERKGHFINGHCFVSLVMLIPAMMSSGLKYIPIVVAQRMWNKYLNKLDIAYELVLQARSVIGENRQLILLCDSWYPKGKIAGLKNLQNIDIICNVRHDSVMIELTPPKKEKGAVGRHRTKGDRVRLDDFELVPVPETIYCVGVRMVKAKIFVRAQACPGSGSLSQCPLTGSTCEACPDDTSAPSTAQADARKWLTACPCDRIQKSHQLISHGNKNRQQGACLPHSYEWGMRRRVSPVMKRPYSHPFVCTPCPGALAQDPCPCALPMRALFCRHLFSASFPYKTG